MHTVEMLDQAVATARRLGFQIRMEWLGGSGGGDCEIKGQRWIFIDLAQTPAEQLDVLLDAIDREAAESVLPLAIQPNLQALLELRKSA